MNWMRETAAAVSLLVFVVSSFVMAGALAV
jgi:hypothetical protein